MRCSRRRFDAPSLSEGFPPPALKSLFRALKNPAPRCPPPTSTIGSFDKPTSEVVSEPRRPPEPAFGALARDGAALAGPNACFHPRLTTPKTPNAPTEIEAFEKLRQ